MKYSKPKVQGRKGIALVTVITLLALATGLVLALFTTTQSELAATTSSVEGSQARQQAEIAANLVVAQLQRATRQDEGTSGREIWSSQPGMVRQYRESGRLLRAYKLYSSPEMVLHSNSDSDADDTRMMSAIANDMPDPEWDQHPERWVDMNEPVWRENSSTNTLRLIFPIVDPRAYVNGTTDVARQRSVEGFRYSENLDGSVSGAASKLNGVRLSQAGTGADDQQRVPMPVQWIYVLKDGTLGYLDDTNTFVGAAGEKASVDNPIATRVAFWTDDESCKVNINTAGEGTPWAVPLYFHERDGEWARFQPMMFEYQRYPGHPASVGMSSVLFPNVPINPSRTSGSSDTATADFTRALELKETIYGLMPKLVPGGSRAGSVAVPPGREFTPTDFANVQEAMRQRLFPTVDEFLLQEKVSGGERQEIQFPSTSVWGGVPLPEVIERTRFFMTPNSRAPETNPFGMPKVAMWPLHNSASPAEENQYRTVFDRLIARASTIGSDEYYFRRQFSNRQTEATDYTRNARLLTMLRALTSKPVPGFGENGVTLAAKYGDNNEQILTQIFDYIRSANLHDDSLAEAALKAKGANLDTVNIPWVPDGRKNAYSPTGGMMANTFTPTRRGKNSGDVGGVSMGSYAGHGQVIPTERTVSGKAYRGMGRFPTISEIGLHFICTAEGTNRAGGGSALKQSAGAGDFPQPNPASGYVADNFSSAPWDDTPRWFSNFPPLTDVAAKKSSAWYSTMYPSVGGVPAGAPEFMDTMTGDQARHPGYNPAYWNWTLDTNTPLPAGQRRVQATLLWEWFIPAAGWALINPDLEVVVDASKLKMKDANGVDKFLFTSNTGLGAGKYRIKPYEQFNSQNEIYQRGGTTSFRGFLQGRKLPKIGNMPADRGYSGVRDVGTAVENAHRYDLISDFIDVANTGMNFEGGVVTLEIRRTSNGTAATDLLQSFTFDFPKGMMKAPDLIDITQRPSATQQQNGTWSITRQVAPPYWWSYHADGAIGRDASGNFNASSDFGGRLKSTGEITNYGTSGTTGAAQGNVVISNGAINRGDTLHSLLISHGDARLIMGKKVVPATDFVTHRNYGKANIAMAHKLVLANLNKGPGVDYFVDQAETDRYIKGSGYPLDWMPDVPWEGIPLMRRYGDFDHGIANMEDGAYINKPDEGNTLNTFTDNSRVEQSVPYFSHTWISWSGGATYFSPNRQISSPGMLGSLPTGVQANGGTVPGNTPWRTLLFRPQMHVANAANGTQPHPGASSHIKANNNGKIAKLNYGGGTNPPDHLYMDFFWMPVVEPYALSESVSTAGKINMNYQMVPFRHITRATGMHAAMKSELVTALHKRDTKAYKSRPGGAPSGNGQRWFWKTNDANSSQNKYWHRHIDADATLSLFDERFAAGFAFVLPSQICEMFLLPKKANSSDNDVPQWSNKLTDHLTAGNARGARAFWNQHLPTGDNAKERPYANLYQKLTTKSNTFKVHVRAQTIRKARSSDPTKFDKTLDQITGEYRGSSVIERFFDETTFAELPTGQRDYAAGSAGEITNESNRPPLDHYHRFRIVGQKHFD